jgi:hypothetical protein
MEDILNYQESGFRKNKKHSQKALGSKFELKYQSSRCKRGEESFNILKSPNKSIEGETIEKGYDNLLEEVKRVA